MKSWLRQLIILGTVLGIAGALVMVTGAMPIGASSGHWDITSWILDFSMKRSISTYAMNVKSPEKFENWMVIKGAGYYEIGCRQCHGRPGTNNYLFQHMAPPAPKLKSKIKEWSKEELFQIVSHGVKFTAMPAWPQRKRADEVWAVVAFLMKLPDLSPEQYEQMVYADTNNASLKFCANCHGIDGNGRGSAAFPKLAGQNYAYLKNSLVAYSRHERPSGIMEVAVSSLNQEMIEEFSRYYSKLKRTAEPLPESYRESIKRGRIIAEKGLPEDKVASCIACHGPHKEVKKINEHYPKLAGQPAEYLSLQMSLFIEGKRGGTKYSNIMHKALSSMTEEQMNDVARYYQTLLP